MATSLSIPNLGKSPFVFSTGELAKQANGSVCAAYGDTVVLASACMSKEPSPGKDFFPLMVEYQERTYAMGKIPGGFFKKEGRPKDKEILTARLIDRPIRPLFPKGMTNEDIFTEINKLGLEQELWIFDSAEAKSLEEMSRMGLYCKGSIKGAGSVMAGINQIRQYEVYASKESKNLQKEYTWYVWEQDREGTRINKIKQNSMDHCMDAIRYGVTTGLSKHRDLVIV